jgi:hypothetical protein
VRRPSVAPDVLADLIRSVPARVAKRLDASPLAAEAWTWTAAEAVTVAAGEETVSLAGEVRALSDASCTCLLQPRCFHLLAVLSVLPIGAPASNDEPRAEAPPGAAHDGALPAPLSSEARASAAQAFEVGAGLLTDGLSRASTLRMGELIRVVHACRRDGLPRLESAALAVYETARDLREKDPDFRLEDAAGRIAELLLVASRLVDGDATREWRGVGRRTYTERRSLRLAGLGSEPVLSKGYAGVVTYFTDGASVFAAQEVMPGDDERALHAYDAQLRFGETSLSHREAARGGLLFASAQISPDGRLGAGKSVVCVSTAHDEGLVSRLFEAPVARQLDRAGRGDAHGLVFVRGTLTGGSDADEWGLVVDHEEPHARVDVPAVTPAVTLPVAVPIDDLRFAFRENLERLGRAAAHVRLVGRVTSGGAPIAPVAIGLDDGRWFSLGYDRLAARDLPPAGPELTSPGVTRASRSAVLDAVRRRVQRFALAGAASLPSAALPEITREAERLRAALMSVGADTLTALARAPRDSPAEVARAWLALHVYWRVAETTLARARWGLEP